VNPSRVATSPPFTVRLTFHGDLAFFLKQAAPGPTIIRRLNEKTSVKDIIESCGVPHPEVDLILVEGVPVDFSYALQRNTTIEIYPVGFTHTASPHERALRDDIKRFIADGHLGKLTRNLRLLGIDVAYLRAAEDRQLLETMQRENRALLTRDRRLLMHAIVQHGYYPRSQEATEQTIEVVRRFDLLSSIAPFTRCLHCNAPLQQVEKAEVMEELEPLTRIYYHQFRRCTGCGQIYWRGSHFSKLEARLQQIRAQCSGPVS
jgi:uncharacterized protein with PIN domain